MDEGQAVDGEHLPAVLAAGSGWKAVPMPDDETVGAWTLDELTERLAGREVIAGPFQRTLKQIAPGMGCTEAVQFYAYVKPKSA